jgi:hypothetical protein
VKSYILILPFLICSCEYSLNSRDHIDFTESEIESVKKSIHEVQKIFERLEDADFSKYQLGYQFYRYDKVFFSPYCLSENGQNYLDSKTCNFDVYLTLDESKLLKESILELSKFNISGCHFESVYDNYIFSIKADHYHEGLMRGYVIPKNLIPDIITNGNSYYKIYDIKDSLVLVGDAPLAPTRPRL